MKVESLKERTAAVEEAWIDGIKIITAFRGDIKNAYEYIEELEDIIKHAQQIIDDIFAQGQEAEFHFLAECPNLRLLKPAEEKTPKKEIGKYL